MLSQRCPKVVADLSQFCTILVLIFYQRCPKVVSELVHVMLMCYPCSIQVLPSGLQVIPSCAQSCLKVVPSGAQVLFAKFPTGANWCQVVPIYVTMCPRDVP